MVPTTRYHQDALFRILDQQLEMITRRQALEAGLTKHALEHRLRPGGPWRSLLPGVYLAATGTPSGLQQEMAALLYAGSGSVITGQAALRCHHIGRTVPDLIDVLVPADRKRRDAALVRLHRTTRMPERILERGPIRYVPSARAVADTVRDMACLRDVRAVVADAVQRDRCTVRDLGAELALYGQDGTFIARPDAWWPELGIAIEVDSHEWHMPPEDHAHTLARGRRMGKYQIVVLRFTPKQIRSEPASVVRDIRDVLEGARGRPPLNLRTVPADDASAPRQRTTPAHLASKVRP